MLPIYQRVGAAAYKKDLSNTLALLEVLQNPHLQLKCIHIAGTNGKGSVSHMIASALQEAGYTCGLYISPHYKDYRERIKINGSYINEAFVIDFVAKMKDAIETIQPSFFELTVAMAFDYFAQNNIDYAIIETGLGGRLDSTNVIDPILSVITNISYDHMNMLGNTLPEIASEKAGIIKLNRPIVIGETQNEIKHVFINKAAEQQSLIYFADKEMQLSNYSCNEFGEASFDILYKNEPFIEQLKVDYASSYQQKNVITACYSLLILNKLGIAINPLQIQKGFENLKNNTSFIGRWMIIDKQPLTVFDSAHNEAGINELKNQLLQLNYTHLHWVYGAVNDKDLSKIIALLPKKNTTYYLCKPAIPRGLDTTELANYFEINQLKYQICNSVPDAYQTALNNRIINEMVLVAGSIFVVAEVI